ncbi:MAG: PPOX class F420-dependent oxidoreductase [Acidimicrobiales bacterium]
MGDTSLAANKYVSLTTYRKDGTAKATPVWIADLGDGTMGFTTASSSWKVRRLNSNPSVKLQPCDARGNVEPGAPSAEGTASVTVGGDEFERVRAEIRRKYGFQVQLIVVFQKLMGLIGRGTGSDSAVIVTVPKED